MANYFARKAGNIDAADVWATTPTGTAADVWSTFTTADVLHSNNFAITVNVSTTVGEVRNDNANSATAGGSFTLQNGITLTANAFAGSTTSPCVTFGQTAGNSASLVGNCQGGSSSSGTGSCATNTSSGALNITGNVTGGTSGNAHGCNNISTGTLNITGNVTGATGTGSTNFAAGTLNITGNCVANANVGAANNSTGTMLVVGTIEASEFNGGVGGANRSQVTLLTGPFLTSPTFGVNPIGCNAWRWAASLNPNTFIEVPTSDLLAKRNLVTADNVTGMPDEADVKDGVVYGPASELTGTFEQTVAPSVSDIAAAVWDEVLTGATHNIPNSAGRRLRILDDERIITDGQVQGAGTNTVTLEPITTLCIGQTVVVTDQTTGNKQVRFILAFDSATNVATVDTQWCDIPNVGDEYQLTTVRSPLIARNDYPSGTIGSEITEMHLLQGLKPGETLTVTPTSRAAGGVSQTIGGDGTTTTTVSRD
jgi:hypothetical protein